jgi:hypothetical protein
MSARVYTIPKGATVTFHDPSPPPVIQFHKAGKVVGTFDCTDGRWRFVGDCEASAQVFVDAAVKMLNATSASPLPLDPHELVGRAVRNAKPAKDGDTFRWGCVMDVFGTGSTVSKELCTAFGLDPWDIIDDNGRIIGSGR